MSYLKSTTFKSKQVKFQTIENLVPKVNQMSFLILISSRHI